MGTAATPLKAAAGLAESDGHRSLSQSTKGLQGAIDGA